MSIVVVNLVLKMSSIMFGSKLLPSKHLLVFKTGLEDAFNKTLA